jgi:hypothetical protein
LIRLGEFDRVASRKRNSAVAAARSARTTDAYLHGGGALGATGAVTGVETALPAALTPFILPASTTETELSSAIRASLAVLAGPALLLVPL